MRSREELTARELQVLALLAEGITDQEIGDRLFISKGTVRHHTRHIYAKLGVNGKVQAAVWFVRNTPEVPPSDLETIPRLPAS